MYVFVFSFTAKGLEETVFTVVGWYTTASPTNEEIKMHKQFCNIISCPIILRLEFVGCEKKVTFSFNIFHFQINYFYPK